MILDRRTLLKLTAASGAAFAIGASRTFAQASSDTLRIGLSTYPAHLKPWVNVGYAGQLVSSLINRFLMAYTPEGKLVGELAESFDRDGDRAWVIKLKDVKFSDGQPVTSADIEWNIEKIKAEGSGAYTRDAMLEVEKVEIVDDRTFKLLTKSPNAALPALFANPFLQIIAKGSTDKQDHGIGAGPFTLANAEKGVGLDFEASPHYFKDGLPHFKKVRVTAYADENLRVAAITAGDVDVIDYVPWSAMDQLDKDASVALETAATGAFMFLSFNGAGAFKDQRLRRAVSLAIRREEIVKGVFFGRGAVLEGVPRSSATPFYNAELAKGQSYDPDRAKALIKEAGAEGVTVNLLSTAQYGMHRDTAVIVQGHLAEVGINVTLTMPDWSTRVTMGNRGQGDFAIQGLGLDTFDPDATSALIDPTLSPTFFRSRNFEVPGLTDLLAKGRAEFDLEKRKAIYAEVDKLVIEYTPFCGLSYRATGFAHLKRVNNFHMLPDQISPFSGRLFDELSLS